MHKHTYVLKEFSSRNILHNHEDSGRCGDDFIELDDVRLPKQFEDLYFAPSQKKEQERKRECQKGKRGEG